MSPIFPEINFKNPCLLFHHSQKFSLPSDELFSFLAFHLIQWLILFRHKSHSRPKHILCVTCVCAHVYLTVLIWFSPAHQSDPELNRDYHLYSTVKETDPGAFSQPSNGSLAGNSLKDCEQVTWPYLASVPGLPHQGDNPYLPASVGIMRHTPGKLS